MNVNFHFKAYSSGYCSFSSSDLTAFINLEQHKCYSNKGPLLFFFVSPSQGDFDYLQNKMYTEVHLLLGYSWHGQNN